jgi:glycogen debranching enzyme
MVMADFAGRDVFLAQGQMAPWYFESARGKLPRAAARFRKRIPEQTLSARKQLMEIKQRIAWEHRPEL